MKRILASLVALAVGSGSWPAHAQMELTGAMFLDVCTRPDFAWIGFCDGYVQAIYDAWHLGAGPGVPTCVPPSVTRTQLVELAVNALQQNPEYRQEQAAIVVYAVMVTAFPCR